MKESIGNLEGELENYDMRTLLEILLYVTKMSNKCSNSKFNTKLIHQLIASFQSGEDEYSETLTGSEGLGESDDQFDSKGEYSSIYQDGSVKKELEEILKNQVYLINLLDSFLKLNLEGSLKEYFEYFYIALNRNITKYSSENLVNLCRTLGDLYLKTKLEGLKILLQKSMYSLLDQIEKYGVKVETYQWIQVIKSVNKCNENHLQKRITSCLLSSMQSDPLGSALLNQDHEKLSELEERCYKYAKLNVHLFSNILLTGMVDNLNLMETILQSVTNYLVYYVSSQSVSTRQLNYSRKGGRNEYNRANELVEELLYKKYRNKVFKLPQSESNTLKLSRGEEVKGDSKEETLLSFGLLKLLHRKKVAFVRGIKLCEMHLRTVYPSIFAKLKNNKLLESARGIPFENEKEYIKVTNDLRENRTTLKRYLEENEEPIIVLVDLYYLISTSYNRKIYFEIFEKSKRSSQEEMKVNQPNDETKFNSTVVNDLRSTDFETNSLSEPVKLSKSLEFKSNYLNSLGWTCVRLYK